MIPLAATLLVFAMDVQPPVRSGETAAPAPAKAATAQAKLPTTDAGPEARVAAEAALRSTLKLVEAAPAKDAFAALEAAAGEAARMLGDASLNRVRLLEAVAKAKTEGDEAKGLRRLRRDLDSLCLDLVFQTRIESPTPEEWPAPTPVGEIAVLDYPTYRLARTPMKSDAQRGQNGAFWKLFNHIQSNSISMTAPVEMSYEGASGAEEPQWMAFLYGARSIGAPGTAGEVEIVDVPAARVLSIGVRGSMGERSMRAARAQLDAWLAARPEWQLCGPARTMGWNSPMVPDAKRYWEVQLHVRRVETAQPPAARQ